MVADPHAAGDDARASQFLRQAAEGQSAEARAALAQMAIDLGRPHIGIRIAKDTAADGIELTAAWREEWVVNPDRRYAHGGVLAALIDLAADWAMVKKLGRPVPTVDLRVDYHAAAMPGDLTAKGKVVRMGGQFSCSEAYIYDKDGKLLASGRGTYFTAPPPPPKG